MFDAVGLALLGAAIAWAFRAAAVSGGSPRPVAGLFLAVGAAYAVGRAGGAMGRPLVPVFVTAVAAVVLLRSPGEVISTSPTGGPFGYANATGAFFVQAVFAAAMVASTSRWRAVAIAGLVAAIGFATVPLAVHSLAAATVVLAFPAAGLAARGPLATRVVIAAGAALLITALVITATVGATSSTPKPNVVDRLVGRALTERRVMLWHDAVAIIRAHPVSGVGPGRFQLVSPIALADRDARWAHNEFLQQGAEQGVIGLLLLVLLFLWGLARLAVSHRPDVTTAFAAAAIAALGIHASVDYVLHFPAIPIAAAALVGAGVVPSRSLLHRSWAKE